MSKTTPMSKAAGENWLGQVESLADEVKILALNLAISLAKSRDQVRELKFLEPEFTKLINGSVEVIREINSIMKAFRNEEKMVYSPKKDSRNLDQIESSLNEILGLSHRVLETVSQLKKKKNQVSSYKKSDFRQ
jgi:methyl-accepting chemotaxis protein